MTTPSSDSTAPPALRVLQGRPSAEELAAVTVALTAAEGTRPTPAPRPRWLLAARWEGVGTGMIAGPGDLPRG